MDIANVAEGFLSPVVAGAYIYRLHNPGILKCWKFSDGKEMFFERLTGVSSASSPITTPDGRVYLAGGVKSYVIKSGPKLEVLGVNDLNDSCESSAAVAGAHIFLKGRQYLYCIGKK